MTGMSSNWAFVTPDMMLGALCLLLGALLPVPEEAQVWPHFINEGGERDERNVHPTASMKPVSTKHYNFFVVVLASRFKEHFQKDLSNN